MATASSLHRQICSGRPWVQAGILVLFRVLNTWPGWLSLFLKALTQKTPVSRISGETSDVSGTSLSRKHRDVPSASSFLPNFRTD